MFVSNLKKLSVDTYSKLILGTMIGDHFMISGSGRTGFTCSDSMEFH